MEATGSLIQVQFKPSPARDTTTLILMSVSNGSRQELGPGSQYWKAYVEEILNLLTKTLLIWIVCDQFTPLMSSATDCGLSRSWATRAKPKAKYFDSKYCWNIFPKYYWNILESEASHEAGD